MKIGIHEVQGVEIDQQSRCYHYHTPVDVVAIQFYCCREWYSCYSCHQELCDHPPRVWPRDQWHAHALLCGCCGHTMSIHEYVATGERCPHCQASFNPGCKTHKHLYFES